MKKLLLITMLLATVGCKSNEIKDYKNYLDNSSDLIIDSVYSKDRISYKTDNIIKIVEKTTELRELNNKTYKINVDKVTLFIKLDSTPTENELNELIKQFKVPFDIRLLEGNGKTCVYKDNDIYICIVVGDNGMIITRKTY